jgi:hypothetical protein
MDNFNLKKFLVENKLTSNSKQIKEGNIPNDIVWTSEEEDTGSHGTFNQLDLDASDLDYYEVEVLGYSTSTGKAYSGQTSGEYGEVNYDDIDEIKEMNPEETENYILYLKKYEPEHFRKMSQLNTKELSEEENGGTFFKATVNLADKPGYDYGYTLYAQDEEGARRELDSKLQGQEYQVKDLKGPFTSQPEQGELSSRVDKSSIELDGVDPSDYPDFVDAFISAANFEDGTPLTDDELDQLGDEMSDEIHQIAYDSLMEGLSEREKTLKEAVLKTLNESKKKNTATQLRSIVKQIIKEEVSSGNSTQIVLYTNEMGRVGAKSRENVTNQTKMVEALKNSVTVNFTIRYIHEKGSTGNDLVVGTLTPVSRGKDDGTGRPRPVAEVEIKLYSKYAEQNRNYEGKESVNDTLQLIMRYGQNSAENMIKNNSSQQAEPVNERLMKGLTKREKTLKEAVLKALK